MQSLAFLIPGRLETRTGAYEYDRRVIDGLRFNGWDVVIRTLDSSFPHPTADALAHARAVLAALPQAMTVLIDGQALGAMPEVADEQAERLRLVALVHHPLAGETGLDPETAGILERSEREALEHVRRVVVTSRMTAAALAPYGVTINRIVVVEPGTDRAPISRGSEGARTELLCVASLSPRKGHAVLLRALARLRDRAWFLTCVGGSEGGLKGAATLQTVLRAEALEDRVHFAGEAGAAAIARYFDRSDVFVLPTLYEGYGMVVAEALARGLPVLSTPTGAIADLVGTDAGRLMAPGDVDGWTAALAEVFNPAARARLAEGARRVRDGLQTWEDATAKMVVALTGLPGVTRRRSGGQVHAGDG